MNIIYERLQNLCQSKGTTYTAVCKELKIQPSVIGNLKSRENGILKADKAVALANYFGVSTDYLLGKADEPYPIKSPSLVEDQIKAAFWGGESDLSAEEIDELWAETKDYIAFKTAQRKKKK